MSIVDGLVGAGVERDLGGGYATPVNSFPEKNFKFYAWSGDLVDVEDVLLVVVNTLSESWGW